MLENSQTKKYYKADELANALGIKKFVIRTWEKQFDLNRTESQYSEDDLKIFETIRDLLYEQKLSPSVAKQKLPTILLEKAREYQQTASAEPKITLESAPSITEAMQEQQAQTPAQEVVEFKQETSTIEESEEIVAATRSEETVENQVQPAFKQNEEFWNNLRSFKEQLLKIQEQLK